MKLKKSIEKAKQQRQELEQKTSAPGMLPDGTGESVSEKTSLSNDWQAPVYCESCSIHLDFDLLAQNRCVSMLLRSVAVVGPLGTGGDHPR